MPTPETTTAPTKKSRVTVAARTPGKVILGTYKHKDTGRAHTVTKIEKDIPFGSGTEHRIWFTAPHMLEPRGWPEQQFLDEMSDEDPIPTPQEEKKDAEPKAPAN